MFVFNQYSMLVLDVLFTLYDIVFKLSLRYLKYSAASALSGNMENYFDFGLSSIKTSLSKMQKNICLKNFIEILWFCEDVGTNKQTGVFQIQNLLN